MLRVLDVNALQARGKLSEEVCVLSGGQGWRQFGLVRQRLGELGSPPSLRALGSGHEHRELRVVVGERDGGAHAHRPIRAAALAMAARAAVFASESVVGA